MAMNSRIDFEASDQVKALLMVCSHERSGTHFLIDSLSSCTEYTNNPLFYFDYRPFLGSDHIFFSEERNIKLFKRLSNLKIENNKLCMKSIIKSHFPVSMIGQKIPENLLIAYIYRNPVDVLISFWKLLHRISYPEGPKTNSPLELAKHVPIGHSQRYQISNVRSYFDRWAEHVSIAHKYSKKHNNISLISYNELSEKYNESISYLSNKLGINITNKLDSPKKEDRSNSTYIKGAEISLSEAEYSDLYTHCSNEIKNYPDLPKNIMAA